MVKACADPHPYPPPLRGRGRLSRRGQRLRVAGLETQLARRPKPPLPQSGGGYGWGLAASIKHRSPP